MKNLITIACLLFSLPLMAQTKVVKKNAVKANNFGITYSLPKTQLIIDAEVTKVTCKAGPYYKYAEKYLGVKDAVTEDKVYYELGKLSLVNKGIPDPDNTYIVEFKSGTVAPYAYLTEDGLLCSINAEYTPEESELESIKKNGQGPAKVTDASVFSEELLMAGSTARQAEVAAKQIYRIRESRLNILTGDADNLPPDGEAMKLVIQQLEEQEKALSNLFTGILTKETSHYEVSITPYDNLDKEVLFRFSNLMGIVDADDLGGVPVYMNLKATERAPVLDPKEAEKKEKSMKGIIYNVPGKASIEISSPTTAQTTEITAAQKITPRKLRNSRMADSAGKTISAEVSREPTRFMARTMMTAVTTAISRLYMPARIPVAAAKVSSKVTAKILW